MAIIDSFVKQFISQIPTLNSDILFSTCSGKVHASLNFKLVFCTINLSSAVLIQ